MRTTVTLDQDVERLLKKATRRRLADELDADAFRAPRSGTSAKQSVGQDTLIVPDVNLQLYADDADSPCHAAAAAWWRACLSGSEPVGLPPVVVFGFVRIGTSARVFEQPMTPGEVADHVRAWLAQPVVQVLEPRADHIERVLSLLD